jgi:hypothetical protein
VASGFFSKLLVQVWSISIMERGGLMYRATKAGLTGTLASALRFHRTIWLLVSAELWTRLRKLLRQLPLSEHLRCISS